MTPANDNTRCAVRPLGLPCVDLGPGARLFTGTANVVAGGGVDHGAMVIVRPVAPSPGKYGTSTGSNVRPVDPRLADALLALFDGVGKRGGHVDQLA